MLTDGGEVTEFEIGGTGTPFSGSFLHAAVLRMMSASSAGLIVDLIQVDDMLPILLLLTRVRGAGAKSTRQHPFRLMLS